LGVFNLLCVVGNILLPTFLSLVIDVYTSYLIENNCINTFLLINLSCFSWKYVVWTSSNRWYNCLWCICEYNKYIL